VCVIWLYTPMSYCELRGGVSLYFDKDIFPKFVPMCQTVTT